MILLYTGLDNIPVDYKARMDERYKYGAPYHLMSPILRQFYSEFEDGVIPPDKTEKAANDELIDAYCFTLGVAGIVPKDFLSTYLKDTANPEISKYDIYFHYATRATNDELRESIKNLLGVIKHG